MVCEKVIGDSGMCMKFDNWVYGLKESRVNHCCDEKVCDKIDRALFYFNEFTTEVAKQRKPVMERQSNTCEPSDLYHTKSMQYNKNEEGKS